MLKVLVTGDHPGRVESALNILHASPGVSSVIYGDTKSGAAAAAWANAREIPVVAYLSMTKHSTIFSRFTPDLVLAFAPPATPDLALLLAAEARGVRTHIVPTEENNHD